MDHKSLVYGVDWCRSSAADLPLIDTSPSDSKAVSCASHDCDVSDAAIRDSDKTARLISSCSFYDCQAHLWTVTL
jgi:hypothetical protein